MCKHSSGFSSIYCKLMSPRQGSRVGWSSPPRVGGHCQLHSKGLDHKDHKVTKFLWNLKAGGLENWTSVAQDSMMNRPGNGPKPSSAVP